MSTTSRTTYSKPNVFDWDEEERLNCLIRTNPVTNSKEISSRNSENNKELEEFIKMGQMRNTYDEFENETSDQTELDETIVKDTDKSKKN